MIHLPVVALPALAADAQGAARLVLCFTVYAVGGWAYETVVCSVGARRFERRGFLYGPYCPIYGLGAITVWLLLSWVPDAWAMFLAGCVVATAIEYATSWLLETLFHERWWDYTGWLLNVRGRVCLVGSLVFGGMTLLVNYVLMPMVLGLVDAIDPRQQMLLAALLATVYVVDTLASVGRSAPEDSRLERRAAAVRERAYETIALMRR